MFEIIQVGARRALRTIPPRFVTWNAAHTAATVLQQSVLVTPVIIPDDCVVVKLGWIRNLVHVAGMFTGEGKMALNPDSPYLLTETVVHELVHYLQRSRMGPASYFFTYLWQAFIALFRPGAVHDNHLMEREARRIAADIISAHFYPAGLYDVNQESEPIDAVLAIQRRLT